MELPKIPVTITLECMLKLFLEGGEFRVNLGDKVINLEPDQQSPDIDDLEQSINETIGELRDEMDG